MVLHYLTEIETSRVLGMIQGGMHQVDVVIAMGTSQNDYKQTCKETTRNT